MQELARQRERELRKLADRYGLLGPAAGLVAGLVGARTGAGFSLRAPALPSGHAPTMADRGRYEHRHYRQAAGPRRVLPVFGADGGGGRGLGTPAGLPRPARTSPAPRRVPHRGVPRRRGGLRLPGDRRPHWNADRDGDVPAPPRPPPATGASPAGRGHAPSSPASPRPRCPPRGGTPAGARVEPPHLTQPSPGARCSGVN